jgi:hypothetical protein
MYFEILGEIQWTETIASGRSIRELRRLNRVYGKTSWRKKKGNKNQKILGVKSDGTKISALR